MRVDWGAPGRPPWPSWETRNGCLRGTWGALNRVGGVGRMALASFWCLVLLALEGCWGRSVHGSQSPHEQGLRSSPELPVPDLIESPLKKYDPGLQDLNATELYMILGKGFHPGFMSVSQPLSPPRGRKRNYWWKRRRRKGRPTDRPQSIRGLLDEDHPNKSLSLNNRSRLPPWIADHRTPDASSTTAARRRRGGRKRGGGSSGARGGRRRKDDGRGGGGGGSGRWRRRLRRLLLSITHCPVRWSWKDVGIRFWPRWVKEGRCGGRVLEGEEEEEDVDVPAPTLEGLKGELGKGSLRRGKNRRRNRGQVIPLPRKKAVPGGRREQRRRGERGEQHGKREKGAATAATPGRSKKSKKERAGPEAVFGSKSSVGRVEQGVEVEGGAVEGDEGRVGSKRGALGKGMVRAGRSRRGWTGGEGSGDGSAEPTCSIPAGMVCRPARKRSITLLRWHCREWRDVGDPLREGSGGKGSWTGAGEDNSNLKCQWIKVEYPIVTECSCQCPK